MPGFHGRREADNGPHRGPLSRYNTARKVLADVPMAVSDQARNAGYARRETHEHAPCPPDNTRRSQRLWPIPADGSSKAVKVCLVGRYSNPVGAEGLEPPTCWL